MSTPKRHLVVVRAGEKSLHRGWLAGAAERNWDLVVSWYGDVPYLPVADERVIVRKGGKWEIIHEHFTTMPELLGEYTHVWLPDDDIETDAAAINALFATMEAEGLAVGQPGLTPDSYFTFPHTVGVPGLRLRYTALVEVMMPCLTRGRFERMLPHFADSSSGFGLDLVWARLDADNRGKAAIIDAVTMRHTRPVGKFLAVRLSARGINSRQEGYRMARRFGFTRRREFPCYAAITADGRVLGQLATAWAMFAGYRRLRGRFVEPKEKPRMQRLWRFFYRPTSLTQLTEEGAATER